MEGRISTQEAALTVHKRGCDARGEQRVPVDGRAAAHRKHAAAAVGHYSVTRCVKSRDPTCLRLARPQ